MLKVKSHQGKNKAKVDIRLQNQRQIKIIS